MFSSYTKFPISLAKIFPFVETSDCPLYVFLSSLKINIHKSEIKPVVTHFHYNEYRPFVFVLLIHMPVFLTCSSMYLILSLETQF